MRDDRGLPKPVLILGGTTEKGHNTARYLYQAATSEGRPVFWFDGWKEASSYDGTEPVRSVVFFYGAQERSRWSNRAESWLSGRANNTTRRGLWRGLATLVRKWNTATRGFRFWRTIRRQVVSSVHHDPGTIFYCDDNSMAAAWHAARLWPGAEVRRA